MICEHCGTQAENGARICPKCGAALRGGVGAGGVAGIRQGQMHEPPRVIGYTDGRAFPGAPRR